MRRLLDLHTLRLVALPALMIALGLQSLRVLYPSLTWYLADARGADPLTMAALATAVFLPVFLAARLRRLLGPRTALLLTAALLALFRFVEQLVDLPALDLTLSAAAAVQFVLFLPIWFGNGLSARGDGAPGLAAGLLLGLALDSAVKGAAGTLDLSWQPGLLPLAITGLMCAAAVVLAALEPGPAATAPADPPTVRLLPLLALGPFLMLQCLVYQNQGWIAAVTGVEPAAAFGVVMAGNLAAAAGLTLGFSTGFARRMWIAPAGAVYLTLAAAGADRAAPSFVTVVVLAQLVYGWCWGLLVSAAASPRHPGLRRITLVVGASLMLFLLLSFLYYGSLQIPVPIPRAAFLPGSAALAGLATVLAAWHSRSEAFPRRGTWTSISLGLLLSLAPIVSAAGAGPQPAYRRPPGLPIRVMTYNIHSAYDVAGRQDPEAIARVIEASGADLVALQEVSRGWLVDGSTDLPAWLSRRLGMPFIFRGTSDPVWGNAMLSRDPVLAAGWAPLPRSGTLLPRGFLWAELDVGQAEPLLVIATHLHHVESEHAPRQAQVAALLSFWGGRPNSLLLGDLNARPEYTEMGLIAEAGWTDSWREAGEGAGLTWPAVDPFERIDWIWHTDDLTAVDATVIDSAASDHRPVLATIDTAP